MQLWFELLHVMKGLCDQEKEEEIRDCQRFKVRKLNLKPFLMMFGFGKNPNFV